VRTVLSADWVLPVEKPPLRDGAVVIEGDRIAAVGPAAELGTGTRYEEAAIIPGFVNAHSHLEYAVYAGFGDSLDDFATWISLHTRRKRRIAWPEYVDIARLGVAECLSSGVTTVGDCSYSGAVAVAASELGLRGLVYLEVFGSEPEPALERFDQLRERIDSVLSDRVRLGVSPHAPYSVSAAVYHACAALGLPLATHLSESTSEVRYLLEGGGPWSEIDWLVEPPRTTGTRLLAGKGLLGAEMLAAHCTKVDAEEIALLAEHNVGVAHCPRSNAFLGCGIAPLRELRTAGIRVGLGTDGISSVPSYDFFDELRAAIAAARVREERPSALTASEALELGTLGSAQALGLQDEIGSLRTGKRADFAVVSLSGSPYLPWEDPAAAVVFGGSRERVEATFVGGQVRYERGAFEWHDLHRSAARARARMLAPAP
jgi:cytosine/adenosine deaminase-related metal-dependent hydrolase